MAMPRKTKTTTAVQRAQMRFFTLQEVADILQVSISTLRRAVKAGELAATRVGTLGQIRVSQQALDLYVAHSTTGQPPPTSQVDAQVDAVLSESAEHRQQRQPSMQHDGPVRKVNGTTHGIQWCILNGDVRAALGGLKPGSVDCVVTSPPYYWQRDYEVEGQIGHEQTIDGYVQALAGVFRGVHRVLAADGTVFLNLGDTYYSAKGKPHGRDDKHNGRQMMRRHLRAVDGPGLGLPRKSLIGIPWRVALAMQTDGWTLRSGVLWERPGTLPEPTAHDRPWRTYEHIFIFSKGPRYYFDRGGLKGDEDIWRIVARPENPGAHFAPYPRELVQRCLDVGCKPGGTVLDPFVGSGTTMLTALAQKCPAIGIDLKPEYCDFIVERIRREFAARTTARRETSRGLQANA
jgi:excisionase family DNA binding protein